MSSERRADVLLQSRADSLARLSRTPRALLIACRPRQWVKNLLVLAAPAAAGILTHPDVPGKVAVAFVSFCMLSSATYLVNDVHDRAEDMRNPLKRGRPVASGALSSTQALLAAGTLAVAGLLLATAVRVELTAVAAGYLALTLSYTLWWREVAIADIAAVAGGFVLRALAGGVATSVPVSRWFLVVTSFGALFLVTGKRYAELREHPDTGAARAPLAAYTPEYLRFVMGLSATITATSYCLWALQKSHAEKLSWYELTVVPVVLWLLRYALLLDGGGGQSPERLIMRDPFLLAMSAAWLTLFGVGVYVA
jgi:decaprenyl-phosphate phosphoribosyltransferase